MRLPRFRVRGKNPASFAQVQAVFDAAVQRYYNAHVGQAWVGVLPLDCWQETVRRILCHESSAQFDVRAPRTRRQEYFSLYFAHECDMPIFGPPHGYGYGQLDELGGRGANDDEVWSFVRTSRARFSS
jgi:hypothetical protein